MRFDHETYPVYRCRASCMQDILTRVSRGYLYYTQGVSSSEKVLALVKRFDQRFKFGISKQERYVLSKHGLPKVWLALDVVHQKNTQVRDAVVYPWVLLSDEPEIEGETLKDLTKHPLVWRDRYELKRDTAKKWTWYLHPDQLALLSGTLRQRVDSKNPNALEDVVRWARSYPMFRGIRSAVDLELKKTQRLYDKHQPGFMETVFKKRKPSTAIFPERLPIMPKIALYDDPARILLDVVEAHLEQIKKYQQAEQETIRKVLTGEEELEALLLA